MLSDLVNIDEMLEGISFGEPGEPLRPYEQLMGCLPPSSAYLLPGPYRRLLTDESSPISDFYPRSFTVDMNGKRWPWEAVVLLPFIDSKRLIDASRTLVPNDMLSEEERERNMIGKPLVFLRDPKHLESVPGVGQSRNFDAIEECTAKAKLLEETLLSRKPKDVAVFRPKLSKGVVVAQPGFPTLQEAPIQTLWRRRIGINVFGMRSRYQTAILMMMDDKPTFPPVSVLGKEFIGTTLFIGYPYLTEGFVTAVSDEEMTVRGKEPARFWNKKEKEQWALTKNAALKKCTHGEGLTGTGGWKIPSSENTFSVRPLKGVESLPDGSSVKVFARFEVEVPLDAALISPSRQDPRLTNIPARLEKDPYFLAVAGKDSIETEVRPPTAVENVQATTPDENKTDVLPPTAVEIVQAATPDVIGTEVLPPTAVENVQAAAPDEIETEVLPPAAMESVHATASDESPLTQSVDGMKQLSCILPPRDGELSKLLPTIDHRELVPCIEPSRATQGFESSPVLPPPLEKKAAAVSASDAAQLGAFSSGSPGLLNPLPRVGGRQKRRRRTNRKNRRMARKYCTVRTPLPTSLVRTNATARGRLLGVGAAAAVFFFANGTDGKLASPFIESKSAVLVPPLLECRGGDQEVTDPFGVKCNSGTVPPPPLEFAHGTTTISFIFQGGIIAAVDSRASIGNFVGSKTTQKVLPINE